MKPLRSLLIYNAAADFYGAAVRAAHPALTLHCTSNRAEALARLPEADAFVASAPFVDDELLAAGGGLRWVHALTSGTETITGSARLAADALVTSSRGVHGPQMAELALMLMMALARDLPRMLRQQAEGEWTKWPQPMLWQKQVAIFGCGHVGQTLAQRCKAMGMKVIGISAQPAPLPDFDQVLPRQDGPAVLAASDFVVLLTASDASTRHMVDASFLAAMQAKAFLVNLARGDIVDEAALVAALASGTIAGAGLDVFETEPLPRNHPLWRLPNVILTPHVGGLSDRYSTQVLPILMHNLERMMAGDPGGLRNLVRSSAAASGSSS